MPRHDNLIHVAVGIVKNACGEVLIAKRPPRKYKSGLWEFPGGKIEINETVFQALQREFKEEVNIQIIDAYSWLQIPYDYGDRNVFLDIWLITQFSGEAQGQEGQEIRWVSIDKLDEFQFPDGNKMILEKLKS
jgi:8-oxo-dGTP diphosphatase